MLYLELLIYVLEAPGPNGTAFALRTVQEWESVAAKALLNFVVNLIGGLFNR